MSHQSAKGTGISSTGLLAQIRKGRIQHTIGVFAGRFVFPFDNLAAPEPLQICLYPCRSVHTFGVFPTAKPKQNKVLAFATCLQHKAVQQREVKLSFL